MFLFNCKSLFSVMEAADFLALIATIIIMQYLLPKPSCTYYTHSLIFWPFLDI